MSKFMKAASVAAGVASSFLLYAAASAQVVIPTSTTASLVSAAGSQISDPGTLQLLTYIGGAIFAFWLIHQLIGLIPRSRGGRRS